MFDIPTALTARESEVLGALAHGRRVYEAGALLGYSTCVLAQTAKEVTSVDPHSGYPFNSPSPTWDIFRRNVQRYNLGSRVKAIRDIFQNVASRDHHFAWADLTGEGWLIRKFLNHTWNVPKIALHDYQRSGCGSSTSAIDFYLRNDYRIRSVQVFDTLIVIERNIQ